MNGMCWRSTVQLLNLGRRLHQNLALNNLGNATCGVVSAITVGVITCGVNASDAQISTHTSFNGPFNILNGSVLTRAGQA